MHASNPHDRGHNDPIRTRERHPQERMYGRVYREERHLELAGRPHLQLLHPISVSIPSVPAMIGTADAGGGLSVLWGRHVE